MDHVEACLRSTYAGVLNSIDPTVPPVAEFYQEEYEYGVPFLTPCLFLYEEDPEIKWRSGGTYEFQLPIVIVAWDISTAEGFSVLHRRLKVYRSAIVETFLGHHEVENGYWTGVYLEGYTSTPPMKDDENTYGRARGVVLKFDAIEDYS